MNEVSAPFTDDQVASINSFQSDGRMHEFTCNHRHGGSRSLLAANEGLYCTTLECPYRQDWVYDWMADWMWKKMLDGLTPVN